MNVFQALASGVIVLSLGHAAIGQTPESTNLPADGNGPEVLTRGPIHEAYAEPSRGGDVAPLIAPKRPPDPINEVPPDVKPDEEGSVWISGYWSWDDDRQDYIWVSGVWRAPPPGYLWVAGYWTEGDGGSRWVPGFWTPVAQQNVEYYPDPPESVEQGPTSDSPGADYLWNPGIWVWADGRYAWRPGYWMAANRNWVWVNDSYCWSPRGWIYRAGYWDYPLVRRGVIFAPVYFASGGGWANYTYRPSFVIDSSILTFHLFVRPSYAHYYFGDYYASRYDRFGIYPWYSAGQYAGYRHDPLFAYYSWHNRGRDPNWSRNLRGWHDYYRKHEDRRPAHTLAAQQRIVQQGRDRPDRQFLNIAESADRWSKDPKAPVRLTRVSDENRTRSVETSRLMRDFQKDRARMESGAVAGRDGTRRPGAVKQPETMALPKTAEALSRRMPPADQKLGAVPRRPEGGARTMMKPLTPGDDRTPGREDRGDRRQAVTPGTPGESPRATTPQSPADRRGLSEEPRRDQRGRAAPEAERRVQQLQQEQRTRSESEGRAQQQLQREQRDRAAEAERRTPQSLQRDQPAPVDTQRRAPQQQLQRDQGGPPATERRAPQTPRREQSAPPAARERSSPQRDATGPSRATGSQQERRRMPVPEAGPSRSPGPRPSGSPAPSMERRSPPQGSGGGSPTIRRGDGGGGGASAETRRAPARSESPAARSVAPAPRGGGEQRSTGPRGPQGDDNDPTGKQRGRR